MAAVGRTIGHQFMAECNGMWEKREFELPTIMSIKENDYGY